MSPDLVFLIANLAVLPAWLLLALAPRWEGTQRFVHAGWIPAAIAVVYVWALFAETEPVEGAGFGTLRAVMLLFTSPHAMLAGWVHYLAFDLFVGAWEVRDAQRRGIRHLWVVPCLFFTLMFGPVGLASYLALRFTLTRSWTLVEEVEEPGA